ncbi:MAPEG family protein [Maritalea sp. S77]|jgi:uncharacterized MAPEG superfamily protein|uniref:MAPEG family protein n=1 Tax=Maritalea sp. S77 TaxID=3415125 RepID=UPI003C7AA72C
MSVELTLLIWSTVVAIIYVTTQSFLFKAQVGNRYTITARDEEIVPTGLAGRANRALRNFVETYPIFIALVLAIELLSASNGFSVVGAHIYFWARVLFLPAYLIGTPYVRTFIWKFSALGLVLMMQPLFVAMFWGN